MKFLIRIILALALASGAAGAQEDSLKSRIYHLKPGGAFGGPCERIQRTLTPGEPFRKAVKLSDIDAVEVQADDIALPDTIVSYILEKGRFGELNHPISVPPASAMRVHVSGNKCLEMRVLIDPANNQINSVATDIGTLLVPSAIESCGVALPPVMPGMTRKEAERSLKADAGMSVPFSSERFVAEECHAKAGVVKVVLSFRPASVSEKEYESGKWKGRQPPANPQDVITRVSPYYLDGKVED